MVFSVVSLSCVVSALLSSFTRRTNYSLDRRLLLGIRWNDRVRNDEVLQTDRTGQALQVLSSMAYSSRFGHAARLGRRDTAVSKALHFLVDTSLLLSKGRLTPEPSLKQPQRKTHGLPNVHHVCYPHLHTATVQPSITNFSLRLCPCRTKSLYLSCYSLLPLALLALVARQASGLTD